MTNLVIKNNIELFGPRESSLDGYRDFNLILRHMQLSYELKDISAHFSCLFKGKTPVLPRYSEQALKLWLLPELINNKNILVCNNSQQSLWEQALPNCELEFGKQQLYNKEKRPEFAGIFITQHDGEETLPSLLSDCYSALAPGGLVFLGTFDGSKEVLPALDGSFSELVKWMFINQRFPNSLSTKDNQKANAITIGNAQNPFISSLVNNKSQVILRKPHFQLNA